MLYWYTFFFLVGVGLGF